MARELKTEKAIIAKFESLREEKDELSSSLAARSGDLQEHEIVHKALEPLDPSRKCFRQIGDVLVERTVADVLPAVKINKDQLSAAVTALKEKLDLKQKELADFQAEYKIRIRGEDAAEARPAQQISSSQGVLVAQS